MKNLMLFFLVSLFAFPIFAQSDDDNDGNSQDCIELDAIEVEAGMNEVNISWNDAGAEEFGANGVNLPYTQSDVGITVGFGASSNPSLAVSAEPIIFDVNGSNYTF